jgi:chromate reductase
MKILAFGASNSKASINSKLAAHAAQQVDSSELMFLDLNDFEMPIYSIDREKETGIPALAHQFKEHVRNADGIIISFAEHNGSYSSAFKNILDWVSRIEPSIWLNKAMFLLATSPGPRGGQGVLDSAVMAFPYQGAQLAASFSMPSFHQNFNEESGIISEDLKLAFEKHLGAFVAAVEKNKLALVTN